MRAQGLAPDTAVSTPNGKVPIRALRERDSVFTVDGPAQVCRVTRLLGGELDQPVALRAVRIPAGSLAEGAPARDIVVSAELRLAVAGYWITATSLLLPPLVNHVPVARADWFHLELDRPACFLAEGLAVPALNLDCATLPPAGMLAVRAQIRRRAAVVPGRLLGDVDSLTHAAVCGWAQDPALPAAPVGLTVRCDGTPCAWGLAEAPRAEGGFWFHIPLPATLDPGRAHLVEVGDEAGGLRGSPALLERLPPTGDMLADLPAAQRLALLSAQTDRLARNQAPAASSN